MVKKYLRKTFNPKYGETFCVLSIKGNQAQVTPVGLKHDPQMVHISHLKQVFPADIVIDKIPDYFIFSRKTKLALHRDQVPDLGWHCATTLNTLTGKKKESKGPMWADPDRQPRGSHHLELDLQCIWLRLGCMQVCQTA